jgi:hypothetical protein
MTATDFTPVASLLGGALIGASAVMLMAAKGRIAGVSAVEVLQRCRQAAQRPGVRLLVAERVLRERMTCDPRARSDALADLNMLVRTGGRERTEDEFRALLKVAGWKLQRVIVTSGPVSLIEATP